MKKPKIIASSSTFTPIIDLKSVIRSHSQFFDHLVELIPAKFYLSNDDADSKPWYQGLSKAAKASLKQQSRVNVKLARRNRLDPENKSSSSTLHLLQQQINKMSESDPDELNRKGSFGDLEEDGDEGEIRGKSVDLEEGVGNVNRNESATYEELRQRLRRKIELLRGNRGEGGGKKVDDKKVKNDGKKRKRAENDGEESGKSGNVDVNEGEDAEEIIEYGKVKLGGEEERKKKKKKKKMSKVKELERAKRLQEVKRENMGVAERESWRAATSRAMGVKVHDDARIIKESVKKEKRKKEKNAEKWKERVESQQKMKKERQQKRKDNIMGRIKEKKARKIAKREKKLTRPGFEGRKVGYITAQD
ncbi:ribosomal RNA-processing protein 14-C-like [Olea europaea var. sylvestris]|uniref:ribosomal RNA-processing protein 14-C-like n=1 Tax=Olea europaea var. sylvestris TaxID=158386 RepID=UPI000C1D4985|nr:ribosomal RNA-processing protein 14-C-like [Olea europaea var. sylvestris]